MKMVVLDGNLLNIQFSKVPLALTMGVFDGVHKGHVDLMNQLIEVGRKKNLKTGVMSFYPHPNHIIGETPYLGDLLTKEERIEGIRKLGVDFLFLQDFSPLFSQIERKDFLRQYVQGYLDPQYLLFGYDFKFGKNGLGNYDFAKLELKNCEVSQASPTFQADQVISSSKIRNLLINAKVSEARRNLGYGYKVTGKINSGLKLGRTLGFPTANFSEIKTIIPAQGVYSGYATVREKRYRAVMNIGVKPSVQSVSKISCECHILGLNQEIYGEQVSFEFVDFLRHEIKFPSLDELKKQIEVDIKEVEKKLELYETKN